MKNLLITGGAGFIGSHFIRHILERYDYTVVNYDALTYAGNLENLRDVETDPKYRFVQGDICDREAVHSVIQQYDIDTVVNFAAHTHVDRSLMEPGSFIQTDVFGPYVLLDAAREFGLERILLVSTDEIYGSVPTGSSVETDLPKPSSPYSASKAGGELMGHAYYVTYGVPVLITRGSNTIGPMQYPEKVVPLFTTNAIDDMSLPIYGTGLNVRDYIYVTDHCEGIDTVLHHGVLGEAYNVGAGGDNERDVLTVARTILRIVGKPESLIQHVTDRPGHDIRYSLNCAKLHALGWKPRHDFASAMDKTVRWYMENEPWWRAIKEKGEEYKRFYHAQYHTRV